MNVPARAIVKLQAHQVALLQQLSQIEAVSFARPLGLASLCKEVTNKDVLILGCVQEPDRPHEQLLGYVFAQKYLDELHIIQIAVDKTHRRQGIARTLMQATLEQLQPMHCTLCLLEVRISQTHVFSFYETLGFVHIGSRKNYYQDNREDALVMEYRID